MGRPFYKNPFWFIFLCGVLAILITSGLLYYSLHLQREGRLEQGKDLSWTMAGVVANETERILYGIDQVFTGMAIFLEEQSETPDRLRRSAVRRMLELWKDRNAYLMDLLVVDAQGQIRYWTGPGEPPNVRDRDYVEAHFRNASLKMFVGEPQLSRVHTGRWFFGVSQAQHDRDGGIESIYVAIVRLSHLEQRLSRIDPGAESTLAILSSEGRVYTRVPDADLYTGVMVPRGVMPTQAERWRRGVHQASPLDGQMRIWGMRPVSGHDLVAVASVSEARVLEKLRSDAHYHLAMGVFLTFGISGMTIFIMFLQHRQNRTTAELERLAATDSLTGLTNRRKFMEIAAYEVARLERSKKALSLLMLDVDHFKEINDRYGHDAGDRALKEVATVMKRACRRTDTVARLGGEEFAVLLPETALQGALVGAENLRSEIEKKLIPLAAGRISMTVSIGVSELHADESRIDPALNRADRALYRAKWCGRNQVCDETEVTEQDGQA